jgi:hypothetical protein
VDSPPGELLLANNQLSRALEIERSRYSVLLLAGRPSWEFKFLRRGIQEEKRLQGTYLLSREIGGRVVMRDPPPGSDLSPSDRQPEPVSIIEDEDPGLLQSLIEEADLILVQNMPADRLSGMPGQWLSDWVENGRRVLIFLGGDRSFSAGDYQGHPLGDLLPVDLVPTDDRETGEFTPVIPGEPMGLFPYRPFGDFPFPDLPPLATIHRFRGLRPGAEMLLGARAASGEVVPGLVVQRRGLGYVAALSFDTTWRWSLVGKRPHDLLRFWQTLLLFFLSGEETSPVSLHAAGETFERDEPVRLWLQVSPTLVSGDLPARIRVDVTSEQGSTRPVFLFQNPHEQTRYEGQFMAGQEGRYTAVVSLAGLTAHRSFQVEVDSEELARLERDAGRLQDLSSRTDGTYLARPDVDALLSVVPYEPRTETAVQLRFLGRWPGFIFLLLGFLALEWGVRRWFSLP